MKRVVCVMKNVNPLRYLTYNVLKSYLAFAAAKAVNNSLFSDAVFVPSQSLNNVFLSSLDFPSVNVVLNTIFNEIIVLPPYINISELINVVSSPLFTFELYSFSSLSFADSASFKLLIRASDSVRINTLADVELTISGITGLHIGDHHVFNVILNALSNIQISESVSHKTCVSVDESVEVSSVATFVLTVFADISETVNLASVASVNLVPESLTFLTVTESVSHKYYVNMPEIIILHSIASAGTSTAINISESINLSSSCVDNIALIIESISTVNVGESVTYRFRTTLVESVELRSSASVQTG